MLGLSVFELVVLILVIGAVYKWVIADDKGDGTGSGLDPLAGKNPAPTEPVADANSPPGEAWVAFAVVAGITLFCFAMFGVITLGKAVGGAKGIGFGVLALVAFTSVMIWIISLASTGAKGTAAKVGSGLAAILAGFVLIGFFIGTEMDKDIDRVASRVYDEVVDDFGDAWSDGGDAVSEVSDEMSELGEELSQEMAELADELGLSKPRIELSPNPPAAPTPPEPSARGDQPSRPELPSLPAAPSESAPPAAPTSEDTQAEDAATKAEAMAADESVDPAAADDVMVRVESAPLETTELARADAYTKLRDTLAAKQPELSDNTKWFGYLDEMSDQELRDAFDVREQVTSRELSVGDMHLVTLEASLTAEKLRWMSEQSRDWFAAEQRSRGVRVVTAGGVGAVLALWGIYGALSIGERKQAA
ncbi:MAG: hypothetical protein AAFV43_04515 [Planctomycetota bacterium]